MPGVGALACYRAGSYVGWLSGFCWFVPVRECHYGLPIVNLLRVCARGVAHAYCQRIPTGKRGALQVNVTRCEGQVLRNFDAKLSSADHFGNTKTHIFQILYTNSHIFYDNL